MSGQSGGRRILLTDLNDHLTCKLCGGYFRDATTIIECLHSFCKCCIVKYLENSKLCPVCQMQIHKSKPLLKIRPDQILQDIVYKTVPGFYQSEIQRRREYYRKCLEEKNTVALPKYFEESIENRLYSPDESINLSLEYCISADACDKTDDNHELAFKNLSKRYLRCPAAVTVFHLKKLIKAKYGLTENYQIDIMYKGEHLSDNYTLMDIMYIYHWNTKVSLELTYRILSSVSEKIHLSRNGRESNESSTSSTLRSSEINKPEDSPEGEWKEVQLKISETGIISVTDITNTNNIGEVTNINEISQEISLHKNISNINKEVLELDSQSDIKVLENNVNETFLTNRLLSEGLIDDKNDQLALCNKVSKSIKVKDKVKEKLKSEVISSDKMECEDNNNLINSENILLSTSMKKTKLEKLKSTKANTQKFQNKPSETDDTMTKKNCIKSFSQNKRSPINIEEKCQLHCDKTKCKEHDYLKLSMNFKDNLSLASSISNDSAIPGSSTKSDILTKDENTATAKKKLESAKDPFNSEHNLKKNIFANFDTVANESKNQRETSITPIISSLSQSLSDIATTNLEKISNQQKLEPQKNSLEITPVPNIIPISKPKISIKQNFLIKHTTNANEFSAKNANTCGSGSKINDICAKIGEISKERKKCDFIQTNAEIPDFFKIPKIENPQKYISDIPNVPSYKKEYPAKHISNIPNVPNYKTSNSLSNSGNKVYTASQVLHEKKNKNHSVFTTPSLKLTKVVKVRNTPQKLGNPTLGVKPMYSINDRAKEKDQKCLNPKVSRSMSIMKIDPKTLSPIVSSNDSAISSLYSIEKLQQCNNFSKNANPPISSRNSPTKKQSTNPYIQTHSLTTNPRLIYMHSPQSYPGDPNHKIQHYHPRMPLIRPLIIPPLSVPGTYHNALNIGRFYEHSSLSSHNPEFCSSRTQTLQLQSAPSDNNLLSNISKSRSAPLTTDCSEDSTKMKSKDFILTSLPERTDNNETNINESSEDKKQPVASYKKDNSKNLDKIAKEKLENNNDLLVNKSQSHLLKAVVKQSNNSTFKLCSEKEDNLKPAGKSNTALDSSVETVELDILKSSVSTITNASMPSNKGKLECEKKAQEKNIIDAGKKKIEA